MLPPVVHGRQGGTGRALSGPVLLRAVGLHRTYQGPDGGVVALDGVDLTLTAGESVAVTGPSGSGKSTLLHCLAGLDRPDAGTLVLDGPDPPDGTDLLALRPAALARVRAERFGFVFQGGDLVPELSAVENVELPLLLIGRRRRQAREEALAALERLGLAGRAQSRPGTLSGGQAQRVALARAVVAGPSVVFADEPTASLDSAAAADVVELLRALAADGRAVLVVTHDETVAAAVDRRVRLADGRVVG